MAVSTVLHFSDSRTLLKRLERRIETEEMKFFKCGARIWIWQRFRIPMYITTYLTIRETGVTNTTLNEMKTSNVLRYRRPRNSRQQWSTRVLHWTALAKQWDGWFVSCTGKEGNIECWGLSSLYDIIHTHIHMYTQPIYKYPDIYMYTYIQRYEHTHIRTHNQYINTYTHIYI
jgi:hypothetical protein